MSENQKQKQKNELPQPLRRKFLNFLVNTGIVGLFGSVLYPIIRFLEPPKTTDVSPSSVQAGKVSDLKPNSGRIIRYGREPVILLKTKDGDVRAFSAICTHLGCIVQFRADFEHIWCACHNGHYDLNGINIAGPPPRPLPVFKVNIKDDIIYVSKDKFS
ncbi:MAG: Rieske 2Fe-2S domain-containing protein [Calditrichaeota bacterium]|nr:Rieske 2Fe-2S domain-containing protein [Calditrichota bacterium]